MCVTLIPGFAIAGSVSGPCPVSLRISGYVYSPPCGSGYRSSSSARTFWSSSCWVIGACEYQRSTEPAFCCCCTFCSAGLSSRWYELCDPTTWIWFSRRSSPCDPCREYAVPATPDAACAEVVERGYDAASTSGVAKRAEIAVGSVYRYFPDKRSLIQAIERRNQARYTETVRERLAEVTSWRGAVDVTLETFREMHHT